MTATSTAAPMCMADGRMMLYPVKKGDTLTKIVNEQYNAFGPAAQQKIAEIMELNPQLKSPDMIYAGHMLLLDFTTGTGQPAALGLPDLQQAQQNWNSRPKSDQEELAVTARAVTALGAANVVTGVGGTALAQVETVLSTNKRHYYNAALEYARYKRGIIDKPVYDARRRLHLGRLQDNLGPLEKPLFGNKTVFEKFRMSPGRSADPTAPYLRQIDNLDKLRSRIKYGGVALDFVSLGLDFHDIRTTEDPVQKDKKAVSLATGTVASMAATALGKRIAQVGITRLVVGVALATTPVGWGTALVIGIGSIVAGEVVSHVAAEAYEKHFSHIRIVEIFEEIEIPGLE
ncbi:MAG: hypothetical protein Tsb0019_29030 [Roseibium sp.]